jgi:hypothetical protein
MPKSVFVRDPFPGFDTSDLLAAAQKKAQWNVKLPKASTDPNNT